MNFIIGKYYNIPCLIRKTTKILDPVYYDEQFIWMDLEQITIFKETPIEIMQYVPIINHPHNDIENGQKETHYHYDDRFLNQEIISNGVKYHLDYTPRPTIDGYDKMEYLQLKCLSEKISQSTPVSLINKSKFKHKCIHKGKCPHRGMDLGNIKPHNGIITCPLHGLKFNSKTKQLIEI